MNNRQLKRILGGDGGMDGYTQACEGKKADQDCTVNGKPGKCVGSIGPQLYCETMQGMK